VPVSGCGGAGRGAEGRESFMLRLHCDEWTDLCSRA
jgi:hypothetical protein